MEADALSKDAGHTSTLMGAPETPDISSTTAEPPSSLHSSRSLPSSLPPARPGRPRPPPPTKSSPPPLVALSNSISASCTEGVQQNTLPPPLFPTLVSSSPLLIPQNIASADPASSSPPLPAPLSSKLLPPSDFTTSSSSPQLLTPSDRLTASSSIWQPKGFSKDQIKNIMEQTTAGTFLIHTREDNSLTLSVRLSEEEGTPLVQNLLIKQHKAYIHLDGSSLVFDDIFKLVSFYCISRDILAIPLRLPQAITTATKKEDLEIIAAMGADFWTSDIHQQETNQDDSKMYLYVNPITLGETSVKDPNQPLISTLHTSTNQNVTSLLQNGDSTQNTSLEVKDPKKTVNNQDIKYKRPPPRPPSVGIGSGMGLLFTSSPMPPSTSVGSAAKTKEEVKGNSGEEEERKSTSPAPLRPPVPLHSRGAPPLPPAPLCRISSRKSSNQDAGDGREREKGQNPAKKTEGTIGDEMGDHKAGCKSGLLGDGGNMENSQEEEMKKEKGKGDNEKKEKETILEKYGKEKSSSQCPTSVKRPSRPVPPPRRKPCDSPVCTNQPAPPNQGPGMRMPAPSPPRRPDVSLYSPQGGTVIGTDPDSCSSSSTEEEGDASQEQEQQNHLADSRSTKVTVKRAPTTVMLDRARHRLSTVLTGLISHDRRLTQRIVELARDPLSYFGNLVKEHRAFTLETMSNHLTSTELLQEIRQMITQLKSYLLQSTELQSMLEPQHQYTQDKLENIIEAALCKSVLKPLREPIYHSLKKLRTDDGSLKQLTEHQSIVLGNTTTALGITTAVPEASAMEKISIKLNKLHLDYSPQKKIELLLKACKIIYDSMSVSGPGRAHGADDFLPVMMYVLARSNLSNLQLDVEYMMELMDPSLALGEGSYYLTTTYGAVEHFKSFDQHRSTTRQLSREVQDSIHRWERRRTLNQERVTQASVRDFLTVCCPEMGSNPKTLGVLPSTTVHELAEQCAARFEQDSYILSVFMDGDHRPLEPTELAVSVKNSCQPGTYCFVYHPRDQPNNQQDQPNNQRDRPNNQQDQPNNQQDRPNNQQDQPNNQRDRPNNQQDQPNNQQDQPNNQQDQPNNQRDRPNNQQDQPNNQRDRPNNQRDQPNNQRDRPISQRSRSCPTDPPPAPPVQRFFPAKVAVVDNAEVEAEEESLITL